MIPPERSPERDAALAALLPHIAAHGWTSQALRAGLTDLRQPPEAASWLFNGPAGMIEAYFDLADRRMQQAAAVLPPMRAAARIRALVALRLEQAAGERTALRRAMALLALPGNARLGARVLARSADAIWVAANDRSADWNWYTKRATLAAILAATLLHWLRPEPAGAAARHDGAGPGCGADLQTLAFLDRRLAGAARLGKLRAQVTQSLAALLPDRWRDHPPTRDTAPG